jgi:Protein of unknown function (DUF1353)
MPFSPLDPEIELVQYESNRFKLADGFTLRYRDPRTKKRYTVTQHGIGEDGTDLASVPTALWWYVGSYGRHTPAALLHDVLVRRKGKPTRKEADRIFLRALRDLNVPFIRRWLMWTAVSLETTFLGLPGTWLPGWAKRIIGGLLLAAHMALVVAGVWFAIDAGQPDWVRATAGAVAVSWVVWLLRAVWIPVGLAFVVVPYVVVWWFKRTSALLEVPTAALYSAVSWLRTREGKHLEDPWGPTRVIATPNSIESIDDE